MIIKLKNSVPDKDIDKLKINHKAFHIKSENNHLLITSSGLKNFRKVLQTLQMIFGYLKMICNFLQNLLKVKKEA